MTTTNNMNTKFNFRTKFKKLLNDENRLPIISAFEKFCSLDSEDALEVLWRMTYSSNYAIEELYKFGLDCKMIPSEQIPTFKNELRFQYEELVQPEFLQFYDRDDEKIKNAFLALKKRADGIVASIVCVACNVLMSKSDSEIERTLELLHHPKDNCYFGGIRSMDFDMEEAEYLKPYHIEIHNLLEATNNYIPFYTEEEDAEVEETEACQEEKHPVKKSDKETATGEPDVATAKFKAVTPEEILLHRELFKPFTESDDLNMLLPIGQLGFDLNEIMRKKDEIHNFIKAANALVK